MNRERRAVLNGVAALTVGGVAAAGRAVGTDGRVQTLNTALPPGVTLFDLNGDGEYTATVVEAAEGPRDDAHPRPIHVTSNGRSTVDFAASIVAPSAGTTLGGLGELTYDYYEGSNNVNPDGGGGLAPDQTFLVVENADGRHGVYLTYDAGGDPAETWATFDVLARMAGDTAGTSGWFEYTAIEEGYDGRSFGDVVERFGEDARLLRVGVGHGDAVNPATLDLYYDNLVVDGTRYQFPVDVAQRMSQMSPSSNSL